MTTLLVIGVTSLAYTWHVPADAPTIQTALAFAAPGDIVEVACGTYFEHDLAMPAGVVLRSETGDPECVTIDAQDLGRVVMCDHVADFRLEGLTLTGGDAYATGWYPQSGGGLACIQSSGAIEDCRLTDNRAHDGGGAYLSYSSPTLDDCAFVANLAFAGGGLACFHGDPELNRCTFADHVGIVDGAGLYLTACSARLTDCLIHGNDAEAWGGGIFCTVGSAPVLERCTLAANAAYEGGGLWCVDDSVVRLQASLVAFNTQGAGVFVYDNPGHPSTLDLDCCDVFGNAGGNYGGVADDQTGEDGNISVDPLFCDAAGGDFTVDAQSPCLPAHNTCGVQIGALGAGCGLTPVPAAEAGLALQPCRPNPFNPVTTLEFTLPAAGPVRLEIFAVDGTRIATPLDEVRPAGTQSVNWGGCDDRGRAAPAGIYLGRLEVGGLVVTQRLALVR